MSGPAIAYQPKANANSFGPAAKGMTRNHVIPIAVMRDSKLVQQFLKLPDGGVSIFNFDLKGDNGQYLSRGNNGTAAFDDAPEIVGEGTPDRGYHRAYSDSIEGRLSALENDPGSPYRPLFDGFENVDDFLDGRIPSSTQAAIFFLMFSIRKMPGRRRRRSRGELNVSPDYRAEFEF